MVEEKAIWQWEITKNTSWLGASLKELYAYKDLLFSLVRKEFLSYYQQTLLGPLWVLLQPIITVFTSVIIFHEIMGVSTDGVPPLLYYLAGITLWNLFSDILLGTSSTFSQNEYIFSKVYFPRIIAPLSVVALSFMRFFIQLLFLLIAIFYYYIIGTINLNFIGFFLCLPVIAITACIALGSGLIFSVLTAKYRDLLGIMQLFVRLLMFICPIFYPLSIVPQKVKWIVNANPLSVQFELFRYAFWGKGDFSAQQVTYSIVAALLILAAGVLLFNKTGDKLIDIV